MDLLYFILPLLLIVIVLFVFFRIKKVKHKKTILFVMAAYIFVGYTICFMILKIDRLNCQLASSVRNERDYVAENIKLREENLVIRLTLEQMEYYLDSLINKMSDLNREIKIKDQQIQRLQNQ